MCRLKVSEIEIIPVKPHNGLVAFASCVVNEQFYIGDIAIHSTLTDHDFRLVYPNRSLSNGKTVPCIHPINKETGEFMKQAICERFKELIINRTL